MLKTAWVILLTTTDFKVSPLSSPVPRTPSLDACGPVSQSERPSPPFQPSSGELDPLYVVEVLLRCSRESLKNSATEAAKPAKPEEKGEMQVCA